MQPKPAGSGCSVCSSDLQCQLVSDPTTSSSLSTYASVTPRVFRLSGRKSLKEFLGSAEAYADSQQTGCPVVKSSPNRLNGQPSLKISLHTQTGWSAVKSCLQAEWEAFFPPDVISLPPGFEDVVTLPSDSESGDITAPLGLKMSSFCLLKASYPRWDSYPCPRQ